MSFGVKDLLRYHANIEFIVKSFIRGAALLVCCTAVILASNLLQAGMWVAGLLIIVIVSACKNLPHRLTPAMYSVIETSDDFDKEFSDMSSTSMSTMNMCGHIMIITGITIFLTCVLLTKPVYVGYENGKQYLKETVLLNDTETLLISSIPLGISDSILSTADYLQLKAENAELAKQYEESYKANIAFNKFSFFYMLCLAFIYGASDILFERAYTYKETKKKLLALEQEFQSMSKDLIKEL